MSNIECRNGKSVNLMRLGREEGKLNVERRMSNIECRSWEISELDAVGKGRRKVECRTPNIECRRGNTVDLILLGRKDGTSNVEVGI